MPEEFENANDELRAIFDLKNKEVEAQEEVKEEPKDLLKEEPQEESKEEPKEEVQEEAKEDSTDEETKVDFTDEEKKEDEFGYSRENDPQDEGFDEDAYDKETEKQVAGLDPKERDAWKRLRNEAKQGKTLTKELEALRTELEEAKSKAEQVEEMQARVNSITEKNYKLQIQESDEWKKAVEGPSKVARDTISSVAEDFGVDYDALVDIVADPSVKNRTAQVAAMFPDEDEDGEPLPLNAQYRVTVLNELNAAARAYKTALTEREKLLDQAKDKYEQIQAQRAEEETKSRETEIKQRKSHVDAWVSKYEARFGEEFADEVRSQLKPVVSTPWDQMDIADQTQALTGGAAVPVLLKRLADLEGELATYRKQEKRTKDSSPNMSAGNSPQEKSDASAKALDLDGAMDKFF